MENRIKTKKRSHTVWLIILTIVFVAGLWILWGNTTIKTTTITLHDDNLPTAFDGFKIAQISDLHNAEFGNNHSTLLNILKTEQPDIIAITGDFVDANHTDIDTAVSFAQQAVQIAPCYYVTGNHEAWLGAEYTRLEEQLKACGVTVLRNESVVMEKGPQSIELIGIDDPDFSNTDSLFDLSAGIISSEIQTARQSDNYTVLLSHRPEVFDTYVEQRINLALCGHAHGGQFRLPFIGGVVAPNQGLFPKYDAGVYHDGATTMVVSRGIGNSIIPVRINNRPEVVVVSLHTA